MSPHLGLQRIMIPSAQVSSLTTGSITLPSARGAFDPWAGPEGAFDALATVTLSADTASVTFSGIPNGYKHLQIRSLAKTDRTETDDVVYIQFNSDTGSNYSWHWLRGNSSAASAGAGTSTSYIEINYGATGNSGASDIFAGAVTDILDYSSVNKYTTTRTLNGMDLNGSGWVYFQSGNWRSTSVVTSITIDQKYGSNFKQHSQFALYGVK